MGQDPDNKSDDKSDSKSARKSDSKSDDERSDPQQLAVEQPDYPAIGVVNVVEGENPDV